MHSLYDRSCWRSLSPLFILKQYKISKKNSLIFGQWQITYQKTSRFIQSTRRNYSTNKHGNVSARIIHWPIKRIYLQAVVKETMRLDLAASLLLPQKSQDETEMFGFTIPKNSKVFQNLWSNNSHRLNASICSPSSSFV